jgi:hypothetical protein
LSHQFRQLVFVAHGPNLIGQVFWDFTEASCQDGQNVFVHSLGQYLLNQGQFDDHFLASEN